MATDQGIKNKTSALETDRAWQVNGRLTGHTLQESFLEILYLFSTYKCTRKPLLANFSVDVKNFFGRLRSEDIQYCLSFMKIENCWKFKMLKFL